MWSHPVHLTGGQVCHDRARLSTIACQGLRGARPDTLSRRRFRSVRVFTIDPLTARDLDDALSVERLDNGLLRIGVHIADVTHFVKPDVGNPTVLIKGPHEG